MEDTLNNFIDSQLKQTNSIKKDVAIAHQNITDIDERLTSCESNTAYLLHHNELQRQLKLRNNISIMNVPYDEEEDLKGIITAICSFLGQDLSPSEINDVYRIKSSRSKIIIAKFVNTEVRDGIIKAKSNKKITARDVTNHDNNDPVYINSHVLPYFNRILSYGRQLIREKKLDSCWMAASGVCVRVEPEGKQQTVYSTTHLDDIIYNHRDKISSTKPSTNGKRLAPDNRSPNTNNSRPSKSAKSKK